MNGYDGSWNPDFPPVMHFVDLDNCHAKPWTILEEHPDYDLAKNHEDRLAALSLVHSFLNTQENHAQMQLLKQKYPDAIIVPVHAIEAKGKNRIPGALAEYISKCTDIEINDNIIQTNRVHHTGKDEWHRFAFRPSFNGEVNAGRNYIVVDDVFSNGGSFNELRLFIEKNGGKVVHAVALSLGGHGNEISPNLEIIKELVDKYGTDTLSLFLQEFNLYGGNYKALTNPEAFALRRAPSLDEARSRILAARQAGRSYLVSGSSRKNEYQNPQIDPVELHHRRKFRW
ncbi:MAG: hypothetical protein LBB89_02920 [Treponema sp.]|jgi:hypothetical protein|nr:hypothetical protein [Treponema sp.]